MQHPVIEKELRNRIKKRRMIEIIICTIFLMITISFTIAHAQSRVVEEIDYGFIKRQSVTYNSDLMWGIMIGLLGFIPSIIFLIEDFVFSRLATVEVNGNYLTFYRGLIHTSLYVNGEYKDGLSLFGYYLEAPLPDGTKVTVALGKWSVHLTFSNGYPSIDV